MIPTKLNDFVKQSLCVLSFALVSAGVADCFYDPRDPTIALFGQAKIEANTQISRLSSCSLRNVASLEDERWILERKFELMQDLTNTRNYWYTDQSTVCTLTQFYRYADIQLFHPACQAQARTLREAQYFLIKATIHHFEVFDEARARRLTNAILTADLGCNPTPVCPYPHPNQCPYPNCCQHGAEQDDLESLE